MTDRTATARFIPRATMMAPLAVFFVACFCIAGIVKFRAFGNDFWLAKPAGAIVTSLFLGFVAFMAGRWYFGDPPRSVGRRLLSALVVLLPLMGLLGAFQLTTHDAEAAAADPTPLGGSLGRILAGPKAFGLLGSTVAGILFATLAGIGALLARRMTSEDRGKTGEDPFAVMRAMQQKRGPEPVAAAAVAVLEEEPQAPAQEGGSLFPADAELEPESSAVEMPEPMVAVEEVEEIGPARVIEEPPKRMPVLSGIVDEAVEEDDLPPARFLASALVLEPEATEDEAMVIDLDEPVVAGAIQEAELEIAVGEDQPAEDVAKPETEPEVAPHRITILPPPSVETEEEPSLEPEDEDDPMGDEPELGAMVGEAPELTLEWMAAPGAFHTPRLSDEVTVTTNEAMEEILDVETAKAPEPEPAPTRRRFRVKAVVEEEAPVVIEPVAEEPAPMMVVEEPAAFEIPAELAAQLLGEPAPMMTEELIVPEPAASDEPERKRPSRRRRKPVSEESEPMTTEEVQVPPVMAPEEEPAEPVPAAPTTMEAASPAALEAQLELPSMPAPAAASAESEDDSSRPKRRMRSARKDWASWDEQPSKDRPKLRLVKSDEAAGDEGERQAEIPVSGGGDDSYDKAVAVVVKEDRCSVSLLQRNLGVTFGEATALIDRMYQQGVVGPYQPTGRRDVLKKGAAAAEES